MPKIAQKNIDRLLLLKALYTVRPAWSVRDRQDIGFTAFKMRDKGK